MTKTFVYTHWVRFLSLIKLLRDGILQVCDFCCYTLFWNHFYLFNPILCEATFLPFYCQYCTVLDGGERLYEAPSLHIITCRNNPPVGSLNKHNGSFSPSTLLFLHMRNVFKRKSVEMPAHLCASFKNKKLGGNHSMWRTPFLPRSKTLKLEYSDPIWDSGTNTISCARLYLSATAAASWNGSRCRTESSNPPPSQTV